jgi:hypothetical protein
MMPDAEIHDVGEAAAAEERVSPMDTTLFDGGPLLSLQRWLGLSKDSDRHIGRTAGLVVLVGWLPLVLLALVQSVFLHTDEITSLLWQVGAHARYLVAAPLLVVAELECGARLSVIVGNFVKTGIVPPHERKRLDAAVLTTRRLVNSTAGEIAVVALAYLVVAATIWSTPIEQVPAWHRSDTIVPFYSLAGWWHMLVSLPLLLVLLLSWLTRFLLWVRLLWLISRLKLRLVASHPDHAAGLGFVGHSVRAFSGVALAIAAIAAGYSAHMILVRGSLPTSQIVFDACLLVTVAAMFAAPLLVFTPIMMTAWRHAASEYGALAIQMGVTFEDKWLGQVRRLDNTALNQPDFSSTTDLYSIAANIYQMRLIPIDITSLEILSIVMLLPFVPVVLLIVPMSEILTDLKALFF